MTTKSDGYIGVSPRRRCAPFSRTRLRTRIKYGPFLVAQISARKLPSPILEYRFHMERRWRFDLAWPDIKLALEIEGGVYVGGRHTRGASFERDCEKYAEAMTLGWRVLRVTPKHVQNGVAMAWLERLHRAA